MRDWGPSYLANAERFKAATGVDVWPVMREDPQAFLALNKMMSELPMPDAPTSDDVFDYSIEGIDDPGGKLRQLIDVMFADGVTEEARLRAREEAARINRIIKPALYREMIGWATASALDAWSREKTPPRPFVDPGIERDAAIASIISGIENLLETAPYDPIPWAELDKAEEKTKILDELKAIIPRLESFRLAHHGPAPPRKGTGNLDVFRKTFVEKMRRCWRSWFGEDPKTSKSEPTRGSSCRFVDLVSLAYTEIIGLPVPPSEDGEPGDLRRYISKLATRKGWHKKKCPPSALRSHRRKGA